MAKAWKPGVLTREACAAGAECVDGATKNCLSYVCDAPSTGVCKTACTGDTDCAPSYKCNTGVCVPSGGATCNAELTQSTGPDGKVTNCGLFKCDGADGRCKQVCQIADDCQPGNNCDTTSKTCTPAGADTGSSGGCAFDARDDARGENARTGVALTLAALALVGFGRRRRSRP